MKNFTSLLVVCMVAGNILPLRAQEMLYIGAEEYNGKFATVQRQMNYGDIQGSPYLNDKLIKGWVKFNTGDSTAYFLRYNVYTDEMEYLQGQNLYTVKNMQRLAYVLLADYKFVYREYFIKGRQHRGYLALLVTGQCRLYKRYRMGFVKAKTPESSYDKATPAQFKVKPPQWYVACGSGNISYFGADNASLKELAGDQYAQLKNYMKEQRLKFKNEADLKALFVYYNSLRP